MGKSEKAAFILVTTILVCLLGVIIVRTLSARDDVRVYRVSIITDDVQGDYSQNIWKGLDRAARDYNIDLQVIALHSGMTTEQQRSSLERELEADTDAIIINLQQNPSLSEQLDLSSITVPVISLGTVWNGSSAIRSISTDDTEMGRMLANEMIHDGVTHCVIRASLDNARIRMREAGFVDVMQQQGVDYTFCKDGKHMDLKVRTAYAKYVKWQRSMGMEVLFDTESAFITGLSNYSGTVRKSCPDNERLFDSVKAVVMRLSLATLEKEEVDSFKDA